ncbi:MAG: hypothetical protein KY468_05000 [Armatimonadetes bacterium]|nr:hypothetical protein [Armatimonadota bacterium]
MGLKDALRKAAGLLVELPPETEGQPPAGRDPNADLDRIFKQFSPAGEGDAPARTVEQIVKETDGPNLDEITVPPSELSAALNEQGEVDFQVIYTQAGLPPVPFTAEQMRDMLASLPTELPLETKRQTVNVTLGTMGRTMGLTPETVVADASRKLAALGAFVDNLSKQTTEFVTASEEEISALQARIEEIKGAIQSTKLKQARASQACEAESERLDEVLEFFSLDLPPSRYAAEGPPEPERK